MQVGASTSAAQAADAGTAARRRAQRQRQSARQVRWLTSLVQAQQPHHTDADALCAGCIALRHHVVKLAARVVALERPHAEAHAEPRQDPDRHVSHPLPGQHSEQHTSGVAEAIKHEDTYTAKAQALPVPFPHPVVAHSVGHGPVDAALHVHGVAHSGGDDQQFSVLAAASSCAHVPGAPPLEQYMSAAGAPKAKVRQPTISELQSTYTEQFGEVSGTEDGDVSTVESPTFYSATPSDSGSRHTREVRADPQVLRASLVRTKAAITHLYSSESDSPTGAALKRLDKLIMLEMNLENKLSNLGEGG